MRKSTAKSRSSSRRSSTGSTRRRVASSRVTGPRRRTRLAFTIKHPSLVVIALGAALLAWQMLTTGGKPDPSARFTPDAAGLCGLILLLLGAAGYWLESMGMRSRRP